MAVQREEVMALFASFEALMENRVETVEIARVALEGRVKVLEDRDQASTFRRRGRDSPSEGYIPAKMLMPKTFSDEPEDWRSWREDVLDWIDAVNPGVKDFLEGISKWEEWTSSTSSTYSRIKLIGSEMKGPNFGWL